MSSAYDAVNLAPPVRDAHRIHVKRFLEKAR